MRIPLAPESRPVRSHLSILKDLLAARKVKQIEVAKALGYNSQSQVSMMLKGKRPVGRAELEKMCEMAGITLVALAEMSDDLKLTQRAEAIEAASIIDEVAAEELPALMQLLRAYRNKPVR